MGLFFRLMKIIFGLQADYCKKYEFLAPCSRFHRLSLVKMKASH